VINGLKKPTTSSIFYKEFIAKFLSKKFNLHACRFNGMSYLAAPNDLRSTFILILCIISEQLKTYQSKTPSNHIFFGGALCLAVHTSISLLYNAELNHQHVYAPRKHKSFPSTCCLPSITTFLWPLYLSSCLSVTSHTHTPISSFSSHFSLTQSASLEPEKFLHGHHGLRRVPKVSLVRPLATAGTGGITNPTAKQWRKTTGDKSWQEQTKNWNCIYLSASTCRCQ